MEKNEARLNRQLEAIERTVPVGQRIVRALRKNRYRYVRIPLAILFLMGGLVWFLPIVGIWMLPLGLLMLAIDIPALQPVITTAIIVTRRRVELWRRRFRGRRRRE
jgi:hypothetical protein